MRTRVVVGLVLSVFASAVATAGQPEPEGSWVAGVALGGEVWLVKDGGHQPSAGGAVAGRIGRILGPRTALMADIELSPMRLQYEYGDQDHTTVFGLGESTLLVVRTWWSSSGLWLDTGLGLGVLSAPGAGDARCDGPEAQWHVCPRGVNYGVGFRLGLGLDLVQSDAGALGLELHATPTIFTSEPLMRHESRVGFASGIFVGVSWLWAARSSPASRDRSGVPIR